MSRSMSATTSSSLSRLACGDDLAARIAEVDSAVELADVPRRLFADAIDGADEVAVGHRVRRLLELPQILGQARHRRRRVEHDLGAGQPEQRARLRESGGRSRCRRRPCAHAGLEHRISEIARREIELLPEAREAVRDVRLAILAEILAVGVDDRRGVVVDAGHLLFVDRHDHDHPCFLASSCISLIVGPSGTRSVILYQRGSCSAQKYGP